MQEEKKKVCGECKGTGQVDIQCTCWGTSPQYNCRKCRDNSGWLSEPCTACGGTGYEKG